LISGALIFAGALPTHNRQHNYRIPLNVTARILRLSVAIARRTTQLPPRAARIIIGRQRLHFCACALPKHDRRTTANTIIE